MIERLETGHAAIACFKAVGEVTSDDYETVIVPAVREMVAAHGKARLVYVLGEEFEGWSAGALWDDAKLGLTEARSWERVAVVTDRDWIRHAVRLFGWMVPGDVELFELAEVDASVAWAAGD